MPVRMKSLSLQNRAKRMTIIILLEMRSDRDITALAVAVRVMHMTVIQRLLRG